MRSIVAVIALLASVAFGQSQPDPSLLADIQKIQAIDNHTHVLKVVAAGYNGIIQP